MTTPPSAVYTSSSLDYVLGPQRIAATQENLMAMQAVVIARVATGVHRLNVFFEEWDVAHISVIRWVFELLQVAGGIDCFAELALEPLSKNRIIAHGAKIVRRNSGIIIGSWCGKKFRAENVAARPGWGLVNAVKHHQLFEIKSPNILQPGPAALTDDVIYMHRIFMAWMDTHGASPQ